MIIDEQDDDGDLESEDGEEVDIVDEDVETLEIDEDVNPNDKSAEIFLMQFVSEEVIIRILR